MEHRKVKKRQGFHQQCSALGVLLADPQPEHRVSAMWVATDAPMLELVPPVQRIAVDDPDRAVRDRAQQVVERMLQAMAPDGVLATTQTHAPDALARIQGHGTPGSPGIPGTHQGAA